MALVRLITTYKCNLKCFYCHREGFKEKIELNPNYIPYLTDVIKRAGVNRVTLTGGEPTLYNYLDELIITLYNNGIKVGITTNGTYIKPLLNNKKYLSKITISLPATNRELYKKITKRDLFCKVVENYHILQNEYFGTLKINYIFTQYSANTLDELITLCEELKPHEFNILPLVGLAHYTNEQVKEILKRNNFEITYNKKDTIIKKEGCKFKLRASNYSKYCRDCKLKDLCGERGYVRIYPNLKVTPCLYNKILLDLNEKNLKYAISWWEDVYSS